MDIFFVLSGFLITSILLRDRNKPHYYSNFYWKRALRILPLYLVALATVAAFEPAARGYVLLSLVFLTNFDHLFRVAEAGPFWTLAIEEHFYLAWPCFAQRLSVKGLHRLAFGLAAGCLLLRLTAVAFGHHNFRFTFFHCDGLALGALLACQRVEGWAQRSSAAAWEWHRKKSYLVPTSCLFIFISLIHPPTDRLGMFAEALRMTGTAVLSYWALRAVIQNANSKALAMLRSPLLLFFGSISYCLYIWNLYLADLYDHYAGPLATGTVPRFVARLLAVFAMTVGLCLVSRHLVELPALRLRKAVLR